MSMQWYRFPPGYEGRINKVVQEKQQYGLGGESNHNCGH